MRRALAYLVNILLGHSTPQQDSTNAHLAQILEDMRENQRHLEELLMHDHPFFRDEWRP